MRLPIRACRSAWLAALALLWACSPMAIPPPVAEPGAGFAAGPAGTAGRGSDLWLALRSLELENLQALGPSAEIGTFAAALESALAGRGDEAVTILADLWLQAVDADVRKYSAQLLADLLSNPLLPPADGGDEEVVWSGQLPEVPIRVDRMGIPVIDVLINGRRRKFCLDTGATFTTMALDLARATGLDPDKMPAATALTIGGRSIQVRQTRIHSLGIGGLLIRGHRVAFIPRRYFRFHMGNFVYDIDGVIGWNVLGRACVTIDFKRLRLLFSRPVDDNRGEPNLLWLGYPVVSARSLSGRRLLFGLDTGSGRSFITSAYLAKFPASRVDLARLKFWGVGEYSSTRRFNLPELQLQIGGQVLSLRHLFDLPIDYGTFVRIDGLLGIDAVADRVMVIDLANGRFEIRPPPRL